MYINLQLVETLARQSPVTSQNNITKKLFSVEDVVKFPFGSIFIAVNLYFLVSKIDTQISIITKSQLKDLLYLKSILDYWVMNHSI